MPILHVRINKQDQNIDLSRSVHAQDFILRRAVIVRANDTVDYGGGLAIELGFLKGVEFLSNISENQILTVMKPTELVVDNRYEFTFTSENIQNSFATRVYNYDGVTPVAFDATGAGGEIQLIDLFFEYFERYDGDTY